MALLSFWSNGIPLWVFVFVGFLLFAAASISLGNWIDRQTKLTIDNDGIQFENGLRKVRLDWANIQKVHVMPARWGESVSVIGETAHFEFRTGGEVSFQGEKRGATGFVEGQDILNQIIKKSGLTAMEGEKPGYSYYARE